MTELIDQNESIDSRLDTLTEQMISFETRLNTITEILTSIIDQFTQTMSSVTIPPEQTPINSTLNTLKPNGNEN